MRGSVRRGAGGMLLAALACLAVSGHAAETSSDRASDTPAYSSDAVLVRFDPGAAAAARASARSAAGASLDVRYTIVPGLERLRVGKGRSVEKTIEALHRNPNVLYAEPDYVVTRVATPDDPSYSSLWGMANIKAPAAWDVATGSSDVVVAVIDSGVDRNHPDLAANMWTNPGEIPGNGLDDDGNGYVDDVHGWDFHYNDNNPSDVDGHGTHVAGTIGAVGNNAMGVAGVTWQVKLAALKAIGDTGSGFTSNFVKALQYARDKGIPISNNSWGGGGYSLSLYDAIRELQASGHLFVAAAGNDASNADAWPMYPAAYNLSNIISVASITSADTLSGFSNYGALSVDLGAPGSSILSTIPNGSYATLSGTSMASPHVAGAAALLLSHRPGWTYGQLRETILRTARPIQALSGITATGGTLDLHAALTTLLQFPEFQLSPATIDFGEQRVGVSSPSRTVTMSNTGSLAVPIGSISLKSTPSGQFGASTGCGTTLAVGASCTISVSFAPTTPGLKKATLHVAGDAGAGSSTVSLSGTGIVPEYSLAPGSLEFGEQAVGGSTPAQTITLTNTGKLTLPITGIYDTNGSFPLTHNCGTSVAVGSSCTISVVFSPYWGGVTSGQVYVSAGDGAATKTVAVSGTGIVPEYSLSPTAMEFGTLAVGQTSETRTVTLANTGKLALPISYIASGYGQFSVNHNCGGSVAVGASCTISVAFAPTYGGSINDYIYVYAGGGAENKYVSLTGTALVPEYTLAPASLEFGERAVGTSSPSQAITLTNVGTLPLPITSIGQYVYSFAVTHDCGTSVAAGASCTITVAFAPQYAGDVYEYLYVYGGNGAETKWVELRGTGLVPTYSLSAETLDFGEQGVGTTSDARNLVLTNTGKLALPIDSIGLWLQQFGATHDCGTTVPVNGSCTIRVTYSPAYASAAWEYLYIYVGGGATTRWVQLTGTGVTPLSGHEPGALLVPASDTDGSYVVSWGASSTAGVTYVLEEATNAAFTVGRRVAYQGPGVSAAITGRGGLTYYYRVKSKLAGYTDSAWVTAGNGCTVTLPAATSVTLAPSVASPATVGAAVTFTAAAAGGTGSYEYKFLLRQPGGALTPVRDYASATTWSWDTAGLAVGTYQVVVHARSAGSARSYETYQSISYGLAWPATAVSLVPNIAGPTSPGAIVSFAAAASGGSGNYEYKFLLRLPGGSLNTVRNYSTAATWSWNTAGLAVGTYQVVVHARSVGSTKSYDTYQAMSYGLTTPASAVTLNPSVASPASPGTAVTFTAAASGGSGNYEYKFLLRLPESTLNVVRDYAPNSAWTWNTAGLLAGSYQVVVHARNVGSRQGYESYQALSYSLVSAAQSVDLAPSPASPVAVGTSVTFAAAASGGSGSYEYMFLLRAPGGALSTVQAYSPTPTWNWNTSGATTGTYQVVVRARNAGSTKSYETYQAISYSLTSGPASSVTLTPSPASPATVGTTVTFSAAASGGSGSYEYMFLLRVPGGALDTVRAYSSTPTWNWNTAGNVAGTYQVVVRARNVGSTKSYETFQSASYTLGGLP